MLLICGGNSDPNIHCLIRQAQKTARPHLALLVGLGTNPFIRWDLCEDALFLNGKKATISGAFIRHDVFTNLTDGRSASAHRAYAWYSTVAAWIEVHKEVKNLNRNLKTSLAKPLLLHLARKVGLEIPQTVITNDAHYLKAINKNRPHAVKPVMGGDYCQELEPLLKGISQKGRSFAAPAIVQERLVCPDLRIYIVGQESFGFRIISSVLDYRTTNDAKLEWVGSIDMRLLLPLRRLAKLLCMDFLAADFKACPQTGAFKFLEVNSSPMFSAFDAACDGRLSAAIIHYLRRT